MVISGGTAMVGCTEEVLAGDGVGVRGSHSGL